MNLILLLVLAAGSLFVIRAARQLPVWWREPRR